MLLVYTEGIRESIEKIFSAVLIGGLRKDNPIATEKINLAKISIPRFITMFQSNIFQNEYAIFYDIIVNLNAKTFSRNQLIDVLENNRDLIFKSPFIDLSGYAYVADNRPSTDDEKFEGFKKDVEELFNNLSNNLVLEEDFNTSCVIYADWYKSQLMLQTAQAMSRIMSDQGYEERKPGGRLKKYHGVEDTQAYYNEKIKIIRELSEENRIRALKIDENWFEREMAKEKIKDDKALFTIGIDEVDAEYGELRRGNMLGILGPPKGGKTRFSAFLVQRALSLGYNVVVWALEGTSEEWISMQVASYIRRTQNISINSKDILQRRYLREDYPDKRIRKYVASAKLAMSSGKSMGRLSFIEGVGYVEDFLDVLQAHYDNENPYDLIVIDSLVNIMSKTGKGKVERISEAYMVLKNFINNKLKRPALAIVPAQIKQSVIDYMRKNPEETLDVTAGGESAETIRTPDAVIGIYSSKEERASNIMHIYSVASRHSGDFEDTMIRTDLASCHFYSDVSLNN